MSTTTSKKIASSQIAAEIIQSSVKEFIDENYLPYSYYVIQDRALVPIEEGLKPVQRRILYSMYRSGLRHNSNFMKAGTAASRTMGDFHPHGSTSIEAALARMAQNFSLRVPLIDYRGSVGFLTGDAPAAARYYEVRLNAASMDLLKEIDSGAVEMVENFDGSHMEPLVLPVRWPVTLVNGTSGIAVGYASNIPPHNPTEVMEACVARINNPEMSIKELLSIMPGPDFPTGGEMMMREGVEEYYQTGKGTVIVRGKYEIEQISRGRHQIIFYELPYQISAENVIESIQKAQEKKQLTEISDVKDLSDRKNGLRLSIIIKAGTNASLVLQSLFQLTPVESRFSVNNTVLINGKPEQVGVFRMIDNFLEFRRECIINKSKNRIKIIDKELYKNVGILKVLVDIDKAIAIIRNSNTAVIASDELRKAFDITGEQAKYILEMRLQYLTKADSLEIQKRNEELGQEREDLLSFIKSPSLINDKLKEELEESKKIIQDKRRTTISSVSAEDLKEQDKVARTQARQISKNAPCWIVYYADNTLVKLLEAPKKHEKPVRWVMQAQTLDKLLGITRDGLAFHTSVNHIPLDIPAPPSILGGGHEEDFIGLSKVKPDKKERGLLIVTSMGNVNIVKGGYMASDGPAVSLEDNEEVIYTIWLTEDDYKKSSVAIVSDDGYIARFPASAVRLSNAGAGTIAGMKSTGNVIGAALVRQNDKLFTTTNETVKVVEEKEIATKSGRGIKGVIFQNLSKTEKINHFFAGPEPSILFDNADLFINDKKFQDKLETTSRATRGVKIKNIDKVRSLGWIREGENEG